MKRRSFGKNGLDQVYFPSRNAFFKRKLLLKNTIKWKKKWLKMNATSTKTNKKCRNINKIKECWSDRWIRTYYLTLKYIGSFSHPRAKELHHRCSIVFWVLKGLFSWYSILAGLASFYLSLPCWKKLLVILLLAPCFSY